MGKIRIEEMEFYAYHGHFKEEQIVGNKFLVNIELNTDCTKASISDELCDALDYQRVYSIIKEEMEIPSHLLEHVCRRILDHLFSEFNNIEHAEVKVSKINPPMGGQIGKVSLIMNR